MTKSPFLQEAEEFFEYSKAVRRDLHIHPELGYHEQRTAGLVAYTLNDLGMEVTTGVGKTGVVGLLEGKQPGKTLLVRFDMDALPIQEETGAEYASQNPGVMHACGHDGHVAIGLTVAKILAGHLSELHGNVKFVFQPAEEAMGGAQGMIVDGVLENPKPDMTLAMHVWNERPVGWVGIVPGPLMSAAETLNIKIIGKGGHGAIPQATIDPIVTAAQVILAIQTIISRNIAPLDTAVISITKVQAGETHNVIPPYAILQGTIRTFLPETRAFLIERLHQVVGGVCQAMGCECEMDVESVTPAVINDPLVSEHIRQVTAAEFPQLKIDTQFRTMVSEDMGEMMKIIPGCYLMVGSANDEKKLNYNHHHPKFDFDEQALVNGAAILSAAILDYLKNL